MTCYEHADNCCVGWCKGCQRGVVQDPLEQAVIEAARAYIYAEYASNKQRAELSRLEEAVDALDSEEKWF